MITTIYKYVSFALIVLVVVLFWYANSQHKKTIQLHTQNAELSRALEESNASIRKLDESLIKQNAYISNLKKYSDERIKRYREDLVRIQQQNRETVTRASAIMSKQASSEDVCKSAEILINEEIANVK